MTKKLLILALLTTALLLALSYSARDDLVPFLTRIVSGEGKQFVADPMPSPELPQLFDMGVVDANGDDRLDIYTSAHNYRQNLWIANDHGGYDDVLTAWGLDQSLAFPGAEQSMQAPVMNKPGLYIYWQGDTLHLVTRETERLAPLQGSVRLFNKAEVTRKDGIEVKDNLDRSAPSAVPVTQVDFTATGSSGHLALYLSTRGSPLSFHIASPWPKSQIYVGHKGVIPTSTTFEVPVAAEQNSISQAKPPCAWCKDFELTLRDRHGWAWSDLNDDGQLDAYITRGALGGTLRKFPAGFRNQVADEMLVSERPGRFAERSGELGFSKQDCSGRHVRWVDYNQDGLLDLFVNCLARGHVSGVYPKQLYQQDAHQHFTDVAAKVGLDIPDNQLIDLAWLDVDGDGKVDLLTNEDDGLYLYTQQSGKFTRTLLFRGAFVRADIKGLKGNTEDYWQFDGKLSVADFDADGDPDIFVASKKGNILLINENGRFKSVDPASIGLPKASVAAAWVDYDNDGLLDLHTVPQGLFHQGTDHRFTATGYFRLSDNKYQAAFIHWFDRDNDGKLDVLMALQENAALWRWWEKPFKSRDVKGKDDRFRWKLLAYRNVGKQGHWLQLKLRGRPGNREAIGARVTLFTPRGRQGRVVGSNESSYFSQGHYRQYFGLSDKAQIDDIEVLWPDGQLQKIVNVKPDQLITVVRDVTH